MNRWINFYLESIRYGTWSVEKRVYGMRHFDVQMIGGMVLNAGQIAEMRTGEGKTLTATLPAYLNALLSKGVHVTVNVIRRSVMRLGRVAGRHDCWRRCGKHGSAEKRSVPSWHPIRNKQRVWFLITFVTTWLSVLKTEFNVAYFFAVVDEVRLNLNWWSSYSVSIWPSWR